MTWSRMIRICGSEVFSRILVLHLFVKVCFAEIDRQAQRLGERGNCLVKTYMYSV